MQFIIYWEKLGILTEFSALFDPSKVQLPVFQALPLKMILTLHSAYRTFF